MLSGETTTKTLNHRGHRGHRGAAFAVPCDPCVPCGEKLFRDSATGDLLTNLAEVEMMELAVVPRPGQRRPDCPAPAGQVCRSGFPVTRRFEAGERAPGEELGRVAPDPGGNAGQAASA